MARRFPPRPMARSSPCSAATRRGKRPSRNGLAAARAGWSGRCWSRARRGNDGEVTVLVPPLLPCPVYDVTVQAELLTPDKKTVLAVAFAPVRRMTVKVPLVVKLDGPPRIEAAVNPKTGAMVKIAGQVERKEGLTSDVTLTLTGLPAGATAAPVTLKGGV